MPTKKKSVARPANRRKRASAKATAKQQKAKTKGTRPKAKPSAKAKRRAVAATAHPRSADPPVVAPAFSAPFGVSDAVVYGAAISAYQIQGRAAPDNASWFTNLVRGIVQAQLARNGTPAVVPEVTDLIYFPDGGVDALLDFESPVPRGETPAATLVNPGRTVYQFKWRKDRQAALKAAKQKTGTGAGRKGELRKVLARRSTAPDYYVFATNALLGTGDHAAIKASLRQDCSSFPAKRILVLGASEIEDKVNEDPRIRLAHFGLAASLCTLAVAAAAAETRYRTSPNTPPLVGRASQLAAVRAFVDSPEQRLLAVHGVPGAGKTRLVTAALESVSDRVVWMRTSPTDPASLLQVLDTSPGPVVCVVDAAEALSHDLVLRALETAKAKTIVICDTPPAIGGLKVALGPLSAEDSLTFLNHQAPYLDERQRRWLHSQLGGFPGLLLQGVYALRALPRDEPFEWLQLNDLLNALEAQLTAGLRDSELRSLEAFAILPSVAHTGPGESDLQVVCAAAGIPIGDVLAARGHLSERGLIVGGAGRHRIEVSPPLLAVHIARRRLEAIGTALPGLALRLSPDARAGLVRRTVECSGADAPILRSVFDRLGVFTNVSSLAAHSGVVRAAAESAPELVSWRLGRMIEAAPLEELRDQIGGAARRDLVGALVAATQRRATFHDGARGLLRLAAAENERWANNATGCFTQLFHPTLARPTDGETRAAILTELSETASSIERLVVARAARACMEAQFPVWESDVTASAPPDPTVRPGTWGQLRRSLATTIALLRRLANDSAPEIAGVALAGLTEAIPALLRAGDWDEALNCCDSLLSRPVTAPGRGHLVDMIGHAIHLVDHTIRETHNPTDELEGLRTRLEERVALIRERDFASRFVYHLGGWHPPLTRGTEPELDDSTLADRLAAEVISTPDLLDPDLLDWLTSGEAQRGLYFLFALGRQDRVGRWVGEFEQRIDSERGAISLGAYAAARAEAFPDIGNPYLLSLAARGGRFAEAAVDGSRRGNLGIVRLSVVTTAVASGGVSRERAAYSFHWGVRDSVAIEELLALANSLRDGTPSVEWALLAAVDRWWMERTSERPALLAFAVDVLRTTASGAPATNDTHLWDRVAAEVAAASPAECFALLDEQLNSPYQDSEQIALEYGHGRLLDALSAADRPRLVSILLRAGFERRIFAASLRLPSLLRNLEDRETLLDFAEQNGTPAAVFVAQHLDGGATGFAELLHAILARWGNIHEVRDALLISVGAIRDTYSDRNAELAPRLSWLEPMRVDQSARVREFAELAIDYIQRERRSDW